MPRVLTNVFCGLTLVVFVCFAASSRPGRRQRTRLYLDVQRQGLDGLGGQGRLVVCRGRDDHFAEHAGEAVHQVQLLDVARRQAGRLRIALKYRIVGGNSGIQFRSQERPDWDTYGYQADIDAAGQWAGALFEHARGGIAMRGERVVVDENGKKQVTSLGDPAELMKHIKLEDWNEYRVTAGAARSRWPSTAWSCPRPSTTKRARPPATGSSPCKSIPARR